MIRKTLKYKQAIAIAPDYPHQTQEELYEHLRGKSYFWDSKQGEWEFVNPEDSDPPSKTIRVRVMTGRDLIPHAVDAITDILEVDGFTLLDVSPVYPCRPPKANDGRVYLTFTQ
ncbi:hypothetical protein [Lyngbya sp. CCY1209]|uniref:hypothetical protein n=1 Tax=Lyngbya sp. CCY1209 TaxID=2886103 RepID=UPI002D20C2DE|nr:hypothetical protein [Lyngbya sp. CCY1209]MEB3881948.1 hypothetical protein [Lyngbya sp. CCY1209]